mgnify:CR=1 FL=1
MKKILFLLSLLMLATIDIAYGADYNHYSEWMVASEMARFPNSNCLSSRTSTPKWNYDGAVELESMLDTYLLYPNGNDAIKKYADGFADFMISADGSIYGYKLSDYTLDRVRPGKVILKLYDLNHRAQDSLAIEMLMKQLDTHPRTKAGPWWHKKTYHDQVWLDGIYMGLPLYVMAAPRFRADKLKAYDDDAVMQFVVADSCTYDETTDMWKHAWDESRTLFWADKNTGRSQHSWGRAMGWYAMSLIEVLDELPQGYVGRDTLISIFRHYMSSVVKCQDEESGVWHDVLDVTDSRNYLESTCSAMFTYCLLKGVRLGYLDDSFKAYGLRAYEGLLEKFVKKNSDGTITLTNCCSAAGLGPESNTKRDGSFEYYISEPVVDNDPKGVGPFIWASLEMERLGYTVRRTSTPVDKVSAPSASSKNNVYSLSGSLAGKSISSCRRKGVYIVGGKKVVKKF